MTNNDQTIARLEYLMTTAVLAMMKGDARLGSYRSVVIIAPKSWGWPRADDFSEMIRFPDE